MFAASDTTNEMDSIFTQWNNEAPKIAILRISGNFVTRWERLQAFHFSFLDTWRGDGSPCNFMHGLLIICRKSGPVSTCFLSIKLELIFIFGGSIPNRIETCFHDVFFFWPVCERWLICTMHRRLHMSLSMDVGVFRMPPAALFSTSNQLNRFIPIRKKNINYSLPKVRILGPSLLVTAGTWQKSMSKP